MIRDKDLWRITGDGNDHKSLTGGLMSWIEQLHRAQAELTKRDADPLREKVEAVVRGMEAVSTVALLDLLGLPKTTGNGRRIAPTMRSLGFIPIKSRRLMPGRLPRHRHPRLGAPGSRSQNAHSLVSSI